MLLILVLCGAAPYQSHFVLRYRALTTRLLMFMAAPRTQAKQVVRGGDGGSLTRVQDPFTFPLFTRLASS